MPTEQDVKFSDFIRGLPDASEADLTSGNNMPLVRSGDVGKLPADKILTKPISLITDAVEFVFEDVITDYSFTSGSLKDDGTIVLSTYGYTNVSEYVLLHEGDAVQYELRTSNTTQMVLAVYGTDGTFISAIAGLGENRSLPLFGTFKATQECLIRFTIVTTGEDQYIFLKRASVKTINGNACDVPAIKDSVIGRSVVESTWVIGSVSHTTGQEGATDKRIRSDYIQVNKGDVFAFDHSFGQIVYYDLLKNFTGSLFPSGISQMPNTFVAGFNGFLRIVLSFDVTNGTSIVVNQKDVPLLYSRAYKVLPQKCYEPKERNSFESLVEQKALEVSRIEGIKFGFITDLHYHNSDVNTSDMSGLAANIGRYFNYTQVPDYVDAIVSLGNKTRMDAIVCGGDTIWGTLSPSDSSKLLFRLNKSFERFDGARFILAGNHDFCDEYFSKQDNPTLADCFRPYELANLYRQNKLYGYKDCDGVRAFFLNSSDTFIVENGVKKYSRKSTFGFSAEQLNWFASALASTPHGYHVIVFVHYNPDNITTNGGVITSLLKHFVERDSGTKTAGTGDFAVSIDYDFTQCSNNAVIGVVSGHAHADSLTKNTSNINRLVTTTTTLFEAGSLTRTYGTDTELAFDVLCVNKAERKVKVIRVGAGSDREFTY